MPVPFVKWVGGKTQILEHLLPFFPKKIHNYYEPFLGGGSVLIALLHSCSIGERQVLNKIRASDINPSLIGAYLNIQQHPNELIQALTRLSEEFAVAFAEDNGTTDSSSQSRRSAKAIVNREEAQKSAINYYYWIRQEFNSHSDKRNIEHSAMFLFLNKLCFRGVYREGPHGFNVPYGHCKTIPSIFDHENIHELSVLFQEVEFTCAPFTEVLVTKEEETHALNFWYVDPPYAPINQTSFVGYTKDGFALQMHLHLFDLLVHCSHAFVMSNANVELVRQAFPEPQFNTRVIECRRAIHSKNPASTCSEVIVFNA